MHRAFAVGFYGEPQKHQHFRQYIFNVGIRVIKSCPGVVCLTTLCWRQSLENLIECALLVEQYALDVVGDIAVRARFKLDLLGIGYAEADRGQLCLALSYMCLTPYARPLGVSIDL
jgi:hypothetical protein